jgi:hypothetical protein
MLVEARNAVAMSDGKSTSPAVSSAVLPRCLLEPVDMRDIRLLTED